MNILLRRFLTITLLSVFLASPVAALQNGAEVQRDKLLSYLLRQQLTTNHYQPKEVNDQLSNDAFALYLKQLDVQKRFLLKSDVARLQTFASRMDDEINQGVMELPAVSAAIQKERVRQVRDIVRRQLAKDFDFSRREQFETDPEKLAYADNLPQLAERWRLILKFQVLNRYLSLEEDEAIAADKPAKKITAAERQRTAREKVLKNLDSFFSRMLEEREQDYYDRYFNAVAQAYDPHTNYLPPMQKEDFDIGMSGSLEGIGATLREDAGYIKVVSIIPGSPAARQGQLQAEDVILKVAEKEGEGVDITDTRIRDAVRLIRGKKGTEVRLTVKKPSGLSMVVPIVRDVVQIEETFAKSTILPDTGGNRKFGYLYVPSFYRDFKSAGDGGTGRNVTDDITAELRKLKAAKIDGLVLDLRDNGGGALTDAVATAGLFIKNGPVVQVRASDGRTQVLEDDDNAIEYAGPMVVLVNQFSASASEILAGALQDYGRALVLGGAHTHGKGTVQAVIDLDRTIPFRNMEQYKPLGALKLTTQKFYRVSGESTQYRGVVPDIVLPDRLGHLKTGEKDLDYSLPWDKVESTDFVNWTGLNGTDLPLIRSRSQQRVTASDKFREIAADAEKARSKNEQTMQSVNIADLRQERAEAKKMAEQAGMNLHALMEGGGEPQAAKTESPEEKRLAWEKKIHEDPYAGEAAAVLADILSGQYVIQPKGKSATVGQTKAMHN
ncbi:MAG: carboxy terminal-processing peptidase [Desulfuromonadales bacterium]